jgi:hypothetical protein
MTPMFSICHTTARPNRWGFSYGAWIAGAIGFGTDELEYVLCTDQRWGTFWTPERGIRHVINGGRQCSVDGWNAAAAASTGRVLILNADDFFPPANWDLELRRVIGSRNPLTDEFVIHVSTGNPRDKDLISLGILSRARYERLGYALHPSYESVYSDDEFSEHAYKDGCVIDARHLVFEHRHPGMGKAADDAVYQWQNRREAYESGKANLERRRKEGFPR